MVPMNNFLAQVVRPVCAILESCAEMVASNIPGPMIFDALVSRAAHAFNSSHFDQSMGKGSPHTGPTVVHSAAEYFQSQVACNSGRVNEQKRYK
jgi:hypothetical protein